MNSPDFRRWLLTRPPAVQALAKEFPHGSSFKIEDWPALYVIGWTEDDTVILTAMPPHVMFASHEKYEEGYEARVYLCAKHLRKGAA